MCTRSGSRRVARLKAAITVIAVSTPPRTRRFERGPATSTSAKAAPAYTSTRSVSSTLSPGAADHAAESAVQATSAVIAPRKTTSARVSAALVRSTAASAAAQRSGTLAQPHAVGKNPPCAAARPRSAANATAAGARGARRWRAPVVPPVPSSPTDVAPPVDGLGLAGAALRPPASRLIAVGLVAVRLAVAVTGRRHAGQDETERGRLAR